MTPAFADTREIIRCMWNVHEAGNFGEYLAEFRDRMDPGLVAAIEDGLRYSGAEYVAMRARKLAYWDSVRPLFETYDLLLSPTVSVAAFDVGRLNPEGLAGSSLGLVRLGLVQLPVQLHRPARVHRPRRLHARRHARRASDRRPPLGRPHRAPGLARLRAGPPLGVAAAADRLKSGARHRRSCYCVTPSARVSQARKIAASAMSPPAPLQKNAVDTPQCSETAPTMKAPMGKTPPVSST